MDGLAALPRRNPGERLGDVSNRRGSCLAPTPGRSCAVRNPAFHRPVLGRPAHRRTRPGRPAQLARTLARRGGGRREVSSLGSLPSQRPPYEGRLSRASRVAPCGWRDSRERAGHDPSESRPTVAVFLKGDLSVQGCRWWDSWRATVGDQPSDWRTYRRTGAKLPANQPFLGGLENRYPSLGGSRVRIPPPSAFHVGLCGTAQTHETGKALGHRDDPRSVAVAPQRWRPWRAYAALQLWTSLDNRLGLALFDVLETLTSLVTLPLKAAVDGR